MKQDQRGGVSPSPLQIVQADAVTLRIAVPVKGVTRDRGHLENSEPSISVAKLSGQFGGAVSLPELVFTYAQERCVSQSKGERGSHVEVKPRSLDSRVCCVGKTSVVEYRDKQYSLRTDY